MKNKTLDEHAAEKLASNWKIYIVLFVALGAMTFLGVCNPGGQRSGLSGDAAKVNGEKISFYEFSRAYREESDRMRQQYGEDFKPAQMGVSRQVVERLVSNRVLYLEAINLGLSASDDEVINMLSEVEIFKDEKGIFSSERFENYMNNNHYTEGSFLEEIKRSMTVQKLRSFVSSTSFTSSKAVELDFKLSETKLKIDYIKLDDLAKSVSVSDQEVQEFANKEENLAKIKEWYSSNSSDYSKPERVRASHVLISYKGARNASGEGAKRTKEEAMKKAESLVALLKAGDFAEIAKKETDEPSGKTSGGDLGFFTKEAMVKPFSDAAFALPVGEVSGVVESPFGFHVIKVTGKEEPKNITLDQAKIEIAKKILQKEKAPSYIKEQGANIIAALKEGNENVLAQNNLTWQHSEDFSLESRSIPGFGPTTDLMPKLRGLTKESPLLAEVLTTNGTSLIVKLTERTMADISKLDEEKKKALSRTSSFTQGYFMFSNFEKNAIKRFEDEKQITRNPSFVNYDEIVSRQQQGG